MPVFDPLTAGTLLVLAGAKLTCEQPEATKINVIPSALETKYDYHQSLADLQDYSTDTYDPYSFHGVTRTQGLMQGEIEIRQRIKIGYRTFPRYDAACVWYDEINVDIEIDPTIMIAKEASHDECMHEAVLEHERKHVTIDRKIVNKYAKTIGDVLYKELSRRGFKSGLIHEQDAEEVAARMQTLVKQIVRHEYKKMEIERAEAQRGIDTLEEYERVSAQCPEYKEKLLQQTRYRRR